MSKGWYNDPNSHALASKGAKIRLNPSMSFNEYMKYREQHIGKTTMIDKFLQDEKRIKEFYKLTMKYDDMTDWKLPPIKNIHYAKDYTFIETTDPNILVIIGPHADYYVDKAKYIMSKTPSKKFDYKGIRHLLFLFGNRYMLTDELREVDKLYHDGKIYVVTNKKKINTSIPYEIFVLMYKVRKNLPIRKSIENVVKYKNGEYYVYDISSRKDDYDKIFNYLDSNINTRNKYENIPIRKYRLFASSLDKVFITKIDVSDLNAKSRSEFIKILKNNKPLTEKEYKELIRLIK